MQTEAVNVHVTTPMPSGRELSENPYTDRLAVLDRQASEFLRTSEATLTHYMRALSGLGSGDFVAPLHHSTELERPTFPAGSVEAQLSERAEQISLVLHRARAQLETLSGIELEDATYLLRDAVLGMTGEVMEALSLRDARAAVSWLGDTISGVEERQRHLSRLCAAGAVTGMDAERQHVAEGNLMLALHVRRDALRDQQAWTGVAATTAPLTLEEEPLREALLEVVSLALNTLTDFIACQGHLNQLLHTMQGRGEH